MKHVASFSEISGLPGNYTIEDLANAVGLIVQAGQNSVTSRKVLSANGLEGHSGWDVLTTLRSRVNAAPSILARHRSPVFAVVTTGSILVRFMSAGKFGAISLAALTRKGETTFWWEMRDEREKYESRICMDGFTAICYDINRAVLVNVIIQCESSKKRDELVASFEKAEALNISGMHIDTLHRDKMNEYYIAQICETVDEDATVANDVLCKLKDWKQIAPAINVSTGELMFDEPTVLTMMMATLYSKKSVPALNVVFFGPPQTGKSVALEFQVGEILRGSVEAATASAGKGWLITHKEGVPSKIYSEKVAMLVDEIFKAVSTGIRSNYHSFSLELNSFMQKHMQVLERKDMDASSGAGIVKGRMKCAFVATENNDTVLQRALMKADNISSGPLRRFQFGWVELAKKSSMFERRRSGAAVKDALKANLYRMFGPNALSGIRSLYLYSRTQFIERMELDPSDEWLENCMHELFGIVDRMEEDVPKEFSMHTLDAVRDEKIRSRIVQYINNHDPAIRACWACSAVMRGWEVYDSLEDLRPVFDERQEDMALKTIRYLFVSKLKVLAPGVDDVVSFREGVSRV